MKTLYWIDDTHDHRTLPNSTAQSRFKKGLNVKLDIQQIKDRNQFDKLLSVIDAKKTCAVIMDYQLSSVGEKGQMAYGNTWAAEIRAQYPSIPVIGISHESKSNIPSLRLESFLAFFQRDSLMGAHPPLQSIMALLSGYEQVYKIFKSQAGKSGVDIMLSLIDPPKSVTDMVRAVIPTELRGQWDDETPHVASRWLWHELQGRPGFLFDELELATYLGLNSTGLERIRPKVKAARYQGALASDGRQRWWVCEIRGIVGQLIGDKFIGPVSGSREKLLSALRVLKSDRNKLLSRAYAHKSSDRIPDCVAYRDEQREENDRVQTLLEDTYADDRDANLPFGFEARRIFGPEKHQ